MALQSNIRGQLLSNEAMGKHCSWRTGGNADLYYIPADKQDLALFLSQASDTVPLTWLGLGSNLLVRDGGIRGIVIAVLNRLNEIKLLDSGQLYVESGVTCAKLARFCKNNGLQGAGFLAGIPGTVGGALAMNAGAFGSETWQFVESLEMMDRYGEVTQRPVSDFKVSYRSVKLPDNEWFSAGQFLFPKKNSQRVSRIKPLLEKRNASQPIGLPSCGSVFKNPQGDHAARLIEDCGLKGVCVGGACVSEKHANFIINTGSASASDIEQLIEKIRLDVKQRFNVELQTEVRIIGERL